MNRSMTVAVFAVLVAALVVGGLYLTGMFDGAPASSAPGLGSSPAAGPSPAPTAAVAAPTGPLSPIVTEGFERAREADRDPVAASEANAVRGRILDASGAAVADATVELFIDESPLRGQPREGVVAGRKKSAADGSFAIGGLRDGTLYVLHVDHPDYASERRFPIELAAPPTLTQEIRLDAGLSIRGKVGDENGAAVGGAEILVFEAIGASDVEPRAERVGRSAADGSYELLHLRAGLKRILCRREGYWTDGKPALDLRKPPGLSAIDFVLGKGLEIRGIVVDRATQQPIAGAFLRASPTAPKGGLPAAPAGIPLPRAVLGGGGGDETGESEGERKEDQVKADPGMLAVMQRLTVTESTVSKEDGTFVLSGLLPASYQLTVKARGYQLLQGLAEEAGSNNVTVSLQRAARLLGKVVDADSGAPVRSFVAGATQSPDPTAAMQKRESFDGRDDGSFELVEVRPGTCYVRVDADGYAGGRSDAVNVLPNQDATGIVVRVVRGATVHGRVVDGGGRPIAGAQVGTTAVQENASGAPNPFEIILKRGMLSLTRRTAVTGSDGGFAIRNVLGGRYRIDATHSAFAAGESEVFTCEDKGEVTVATISLIAGATIKGTVRAKDGTPDGKAQITVSQAEPTPGQVPETRTASTNADGSYEIRGLRPGRYRVSRTMAEGQVDLFTIIKSQQDPNAIVPLADGESRVVDF